MKAMALFFLMSGILHSQQFRGGDGKIYEWVTINGNRYIQEVKPPTAEEIERARARHAHQQRQRQIEASRRAAKDREARLRDLEERMDRAEQERWQRELERQAEELRKWREHR